jgi:transcriptional regulator with GAF, ATPase, and Fis domain
VPPPPGETSAKRPALDAMARLSEQLLEARDAAPLVDELLDAVVQATGAERGWVLLADGDERTVRSARSRARETVASAAPALSDPVLRKALETRRPAVASDPAPEPGRKGAAVACVPLLRRGEPVGAIYLALDRPASRVDEGALEILTMLAAQASVLLQHALLLDALRRENAALRAEAEARAELDLLGAGPAMREVVRRVDRVARTDVSVLVTGETGTGKELIAREIHRRSARSGGPFVAVNCGAIPEPLLESELFGHARGAFTGAVSSRPGKFHAASGGTLFLDEIGEMPPALQIKLLRALEDRAVTRVGDAQPEPVDIRIVAATNRVLEDEIRKGTFREDLYYRLHVVSIRLPPLRERPEDVPAIARFFLQRYAREFGSRARGFSPAAVAAMKRSPWPGNLRELENRVKKAAVLADRATLGPEELELSPGERAPVLPLAKAKEEFQRRYIDEVLERNGGNRTRTARELDVDPRTIFRHLERREAGRPGGEPEGE